MANKTLFSSLMGAWAAPAANSVNAAGGVAYRLEPRQALAQYAATGCLHGTFYADAEKQAEVVKALAAEVGPEWVAKVAIHARERGFMKDVPALLAAWLAVRDGALLERVFPRIIDNARMLRNFVQIIRSGATGRRSLGTRPRRMVRQWLAARTPEDLFRQSTGNDPSLADVVKMVHPKPDKEERKAFYAWLIGKEHDAEALPALVRAFEAFKGGSRETVPEVPFLMLTALNLGTAEWTAIARNAGWQTLRMNLNTFLRHGVFADEAMVQEVAARLRDKAEVARARVFPYQILAAWMNADAGLPRPLVAALEEAAEASLENVPPFAGKVVVCPDVSGSMAWAVTGSRPGATSKMRCVDVAGLMSAAVLRRNPTAEVLPFDTTVHAAKLRAGDSVVANAAALAKYGGGGTDCSAPIAELNRRGAKVDAVILVSDNQSWAGLATGRSTPAMEQWLRLKARCRHAKLVCIDIQPCGTTQAPERSDILNVGGFSDAVFDVVGDFLQGTSAERWVDAIDAVTL